MEAKKQLNHEKVGTSHGKTSAQKLSKIETVKEKIKNEKLFQCLLSETIVERSIKESGYRQIKF